MAQNRSSRKEKLDTSFYRSGLDRIRFVTCCCQRITRILPCTMQEKERREKVGGRKKVLQSYFQKSYGRAEAKAREEQFLAF